MVAIHTSKKSQLGALILLSLFVITACGGNHPKDGKGDGNNTDKPANRGDHQDKPTTTTGVMDVIITSSTTISDADKFEGRVNLTGIVAGISKDKKLQPLQGDTAPDGIPIKWKIGTNEADAAALVLDATKTSLEIKKGSEKESPFTGTLPILLVEDDNKALFKNYLKSIDKKDILLPPVAAFAAGDITLDEASPIEVKTDSASAAIAGLKCSFDFKGSDSKDHTIPAVLAVATAASTVAVKSADITASGLTSTAVDASFACSYTAQASKTVRITAVNVITGLKVKTK